MEHYEHMKKKLAFASIVLLATSLSACGGDDGGDGGGGTTNSSGDYCDKLDDAKSSIQALDFRGMGESQFSELQGRLSDVGDSAPADVKDEWVTLNGAIGDFKTLLNDAGLSLDDLQAITENPTDLPDNVDLKKLQELAPKLQEFSEDNDLEAASDAITKHAKSECGIDLEDSGPSSDAPAS